MWVVSYLDNIHNGCIKVTAYDNYEAAYKMYDFECRSDKHYTVSLDEVPVYSSYCVE